jgi:AI-2E family transporter
MSAMPAGPGRSTETPRDTATAGPARHGRLRAAAAARGVPLATIFVTVAVVALTYLAGKLAYRIRDVLLMLMVAGFVALILNPLVVALQRWRIRRRGWAVAIVSVWAVLVFAGLLAAFGYPLAHGLTHFSHRLPSYIQNAEHGRGWIGHLVRRFHLEAWITRNAPKLQSLGATLARPALTVGKGALSLLATLGTIFVLIVLFLLEGPKMRQGLLKLMRPERAAYYTRVAGEISQSATGYALGNLLTSLIAGVVVFVTLTVLGVPFPLLWALWVALVEFSAHGRRRPGRYPYRPVRPKPVADRRHRHCGRVHRLPADRKPRAEPRGHEPHGQGQSAARPAVTPRRDIDRRLDRRLFRQFCRGTAFHPGRGRPPGHRPGTMAGHRVAGTGRQRTARRTGARGP